MIQSVQPPTGAGARCAAQELAGSTPLARLALDVPHGFFKRSMFDAFAEHGVPFSRACWLVKLLYFSRNRCGLREGSTLNPVFQRQPLRPPAALPRDLVRARL